MSATPRVDAIVSGNPDGIKPTETGFAKLASVYSDLLQLARNMEIELSLRPEARRILDEIEVRRAAHRMALPRFMYDTEKACFALARFEQSARDVLGLSQPQSERPSQDEGDKKWVCLPSRQVARGSGK